LSTIVIITPPVKPQLTESGDEETIIKIKLEGDGPISELLREAADVIDGNG
jgi:hypothetical protein